MIPTSISQLYVVGGQQRPGAHYKHEWHRHHKGVIVRADVESGKAETCVEYVSPPSACVADDPAILFKAGTLRGDHLYVCTQTEVLVYRVPDFERVGYLSLPLFNDVHHVRPTADGTLLIANTGLDMVVEVTLDGRVLREWDALGGDPWARFSRATDYRQVPTTKPHASHPNYVFEVGAELWVTRFEQQDAVCLTDRRRRIAIAAGKPHDGIVRGGRVHFTTVNGYIVIADADSCAVVRTIDLNVGLSRDVSLGWCRGLLVVEPDRFLVGFSRLRPTRLIQNIQWAQYQLGMREHVGHLATRVALFDARKNAFTWELDLEEVGMSVIFSLHAGAAHGEPVPPGVTT